MPSYDIGELAEKYETGGRGPGFISNGDSWDPGGDSYGSYQLATRPGTLQGYMNTNLPFVAQLKPYRLKSQSFNKMWKAIAEKFPVEFKQSQFDYVMTISYNPCRRYADSIGIGSGMAIDSALFSTSNQSGGWKKILDDAGINQLDDEEIQVNKLYDARARYFHSLNSLSTKVKAAVIKQRTILEREDCLKLTGESNEQLLL